MGEDNDGRCFWKAGDVFLQPRELLGADFGLGARHVIERDEVNSGVIEGVVALSHEFAVESAAVEAGIVLAGDVFHFADFHPLGDFEELLHALSVDVFVFGVVGEVPGKEDEVGRLREPVDQLHCALECLGAERIGRAIESDVRVAELNES